MSSSMQRIRRRNGHNPSPTTTPIPNISERIAALQHSQSLHKRSSSSDDDTPVGGLRLILPDEDNIIGHSSSSRKNNRRNLDSPTDIIKNNSSGSSRNLWIIMDEKVQNPDVARSPSWAKWSEASFPLKKRSGNKENKKRRSSGLRNDGATRNSIHTTPDTTATTKTCHPQKENYDDNDDDDESLPPITSFTIKNSDNNILTPSPKANQYNIARGRSGGSGSRSDAEVSSTHSSTSINGRINRFLSKINNHTAKNGTKMGPYDSVADANSATTNTKMSLASGNKKKSCLKHAQVLAEAGQRSLTTETTTKDSLCDVTVGDVVQTNSSTDSSSSATKKKFNILGRSLSRSKKKRNSKQQKEETASVAESHQPDRDIDPPVVSNSGSINSGQDSSTLDNQNSSSSNSGGILNRQRKRWNGSRRRKGEVGGRLGIDERIDVFDQDHTNASRRKRLDSHELESLPPVGQYHSDSFSSDTDNADTAVDKAGCSDETETTTTTNTPSRTPNILQRTKRRLSSHGNSVALLASSTSSSRKPHMSRNMDSSTDATPLTAGDIDVTIGKKRTGDVKNDGASNCKNEDNNDHSILRIHSETSDTAEDIDRLLALLEPIEKSLPSSSPSKISNRYDNESNTDVDGLKKNFHKSLTSPQQLQPRTRYVAPVNTKSLNTTAEEKCDNHSQQFATCSEAEPKPPSSLLFGKEGILSSSKSVERSDHQSPIRRSRLQENDSPVKRLTGRIDGNRPSQALNNQSLTKYYPSTNSSLDDDDKSKIERISRQVIPPQIDNEHVEEEISDSPIRRMRQDRMKQNDDFESRYTVKPSNSQSSQRSSIRDHPYFKAHGKREEFDDYSTPEDIPIKKTLLQPLNARARPDPVSRENAESRKHEDEWTTPNQKEVKQVRKKDDPPTVESRDGATRLPKPNKQNVIPILERIKNSVKYVVSPIISQAEGSSAANSNSGHFTVASTSGASNNSKRNDTMKTHGLQSDIDDDKSSWLAEVEEDVQKIRDSYKIGIADNVRKIQNSYKSKAATSPIGSTGLNEQNRLRTEKVVDSDLFCVTNHDRILPEHNPAVTTTDVTPIAGSSTKRGNGVNINEESPTRSQYQFDDRQFASKSIRNYWHQVSNVHTKGSFDSDSQMKATTASSPPRPMDNNPVRTYESTQTTECFDPDGNHPQDEPFFSQQPPHHRTYVGPTSGMMHNNPPGHEHHHDQKQMMMTNENIGAPLVGHEQLEQHHQQHFYHQSPFNQTRVRYNRPVDHISDVPQQYQQYQQQRASPMPPAAPRRMASQDSLQKSRLETFDSDDNISYMTDGNDFVNGRNQQHRGKQQQQHCNQYYDKRRDGSRQRPYDCSVVSSRKQSILPTTGLSVETDDDYTMQTETVADEDQSLHKVRGRNTAATQQQHCSIICGGFDILDFFGGMCSTTK